MKYKIEISSKACCVEEVEAETLSDAITTAAKAFTECLIGNHGVYEFSIKEHKEQGENGRR